MMCLFVHHVCLKQRVDENGEQKRKKSGYIRKDTDNKLGDLFLVDQLQSDHTELVLQFSEKITSPRIWSA